MNALTEQGSISVTLNGLKGESCLPIVFAELIWTVFISISLAKRYFYTFVCDLNISNCILYIFNI